MRRKWMVGCLALLLVATNIGTASGSAQAAVHITDIAEASSNMELVDEAKEEEQGLTKEEDVLETQVLELDESQEETLDFVTSSEEESNQQEQAAEQEQPEQEGQAVQQEDTGTDSGAEEVPEEAPEETPEEEDPSDADMKAWNKAKLNKEYLRIAKLTTAQLYIKNIPNSTSDYRILWKTSSKKIATVDNNGNIVANKAGIAIITCYIKMESGYVKRLTCEIEVTNPKFSQSTYVVTKGNQLMLDVTGTPTEKYKLISSDDYLLKAYVKQPGLIKGKRIGTVSVTAEVDGKIISCKVIVSNPKVKKSLFVMTKEQKDEILVYNQSGKTKVTYTSKNPKIATVSSKGKITTLKIGVAVITVTVDNKEFEITVAVGRSQAVGAIKNAQKVLGATYSQAYRMKKGYYDCSSLVWRCYVPTGLTFGYSKYAYNAPTAAGEAYYLVSHNKEIASTYVDEKNLQPGDLIFMSSGYNGRYRNISHVAIYIGNDIIIHATPRNTNDVQYGTYSYYKNMTVCIGRPA